jgi:hypothetical protein
MLVGERKIVTMKLHLLDNDDDDNEGSGFNDLQFEVEGFML